MGAVSTSIIPAADCDVFQAMMTRRAVRAFLPTPVERSTIEQILARASRAPSGTNTQPWQVWVVAGATQQRLSRRILAAFEADDPTSVEEYPYYPKEWIEPYIGRRRKIGFDLYGLLGIPKGDAAAMKAQFARNYTFFGAPVGLFITIERCMEVGSWYDLGTFLQSILLAARGFGLHSCPQQAFCRFNRIIREELAIPENRIIACGVAIGHEDPDAIENRMRTDRAPVSEFTTFLWD